MTYPFSDFGTGRSKTGTIGSGELENRQGSVGISASLLLSGPAYPKENPGPLGPEYQNRTNEPASADIFASEQNN